MRFYPADSMYVYDLACRQLLIALTVKNGATLFGRPRWVNKRNLRLTQEIAFVRFVQPIRNRARSKYAETIFVTMSAEFGSASLPQRACHRFAWLDALRHLSPANRLET